jgi:hypothetical protein
MQHSKRDSNVFENARNRHLINFGCGRTKGSGCQKLKAAHHGFHSAEENTTIPIRGHSGAMSFGPPLTVDA